VIATEDRRFFQHWGLDLSAMLRAALANLRAGRWVQGGSTLTQQLAKNLFLGSERTLARKFEEVVLALWLELRLGKRNILELYLNRVYFGGGAYGVAGAAQRFFNKSARELNLAEAAVLAGLLKAPSRFSPAANPTLARARAKRVLRAMVEGGLLAPEEAARAGEATINFADAARASQGCLDYALDAVLERLPTLVTVPAGESVVETTLDRDLQCRLQILVHDLLEREGGEARAGQAGLILLGPDGAIRAVIGGRSHAQSPFNRALKARRQPGSAFKLFVYLAALESGMSADSRVLDLPILGGWSPRNEGAGYRGAVTLREAFAHSMNAAAARLHLAVGAHATAAAARRLGIRSPLREDATLALGTSEVTLLELTAAYGALARAGRALEPHLIERVRSSSGRLLYAWPGDAGGTVVGAREVIALNDMLKAVIVSGTGRRAALAQHQAAGKTGTSQDFRDAWFVGYTAHAIAGVWVGNDDNRPMNRVMGGSLPARLWHDAMLIAHEGKPPRPLPAAPEDGDGEPARAAGILPRLPHEPIGTDFVARAIGAGTAPAAAVRNESAEEAGVAGALSRLRHALGL